MKTPRLGKYNDLPKVTQLGQHSAGVWTYFRGTAKPRSLPLPTLPLATARRLLLAFLNTHSESNAKPFCIFHQTASHRGEGCEASQAAPACFRMLRTSVPTLSWGAEQCGAHAHRTRSLGIAANLRGAVALANSFHYCEFTYLKQSKITGKWNQSIYAYLKNNNLEELIFSPNRTDGW